MAQPIPPLVPDPGEGRRAYPYPLPPAGHYPPETLGPEPYDTAATEEEVIRQRDEERRRQQDLTDLLTEDHRTIQGLLAELTDPGTTPERRGEVVEVLIAELSRQVAIERRYLVPAVLDVLPDSDPDRLPAELARLEEATQRLAAHGSDHPEFGSRYDELAELFAGHAGHQQEHLFPQLREAGDREQLWELAQRARAAKATAPTRPHPHAPAEPPWSRATDPVIGAADRIRDEITGRPTEPRDID